MFKVSFIYTGDISEPRAATRLHLQERLVVIMQTYIET